MDATEVLKNAAEQTVGEMKAEKKLEIKNDFTQLKDIEVEEETAIVCAGRPLYNKNVAYAVKVLAAAKLGKKLEVLETEETEPVEE